MGTIKINTNDTREIKASKRVRNEFELGDNIYMGCLVHIERIDAAYKYIQDNGKPATMSTRFWGHIQYPDGTIEKLDTHAKRRGGWIARACGLWVTKERDAMEKLGKLYEVTNRRIVED